jgi:nucleoside phosphorylase
MEREVSALRRSLAGAPVAVRVSGVGREKAQASAETVLDQRARPDCILSLGFAGALRDGLETGDLVLARRLYASGEDTFIESDANLLSMAQEVLDRPGSPRSFIADSVTVPEMVTSSIEKEQLAGGTGAWIANMEDYWVGKAAIHRRVPFLSVRAVLDTARQEPPPYVARLGDKGLLGQVLHVMANGIKRPQDIPEMVNLSKQVKAAQGSLAAFGLSFLAGVTPETEAESCARL